MEPVLTKRIVLPAKLLFEFINFFLLEKFFNRKSIKSFS